MKPAAKLIPVIFILIFFLQAYAVEKKPVIISGNNARTKYIGEKNDRKIYITEITGNPSIKTGNKILKADKIIVRGNDGEIAEALGNVILEDKIKGSRIKASRAVYYKEKDIVEFHGKPDAIIKREDDHSRVRIQAELFRYDINADTMEADGSVKLRNNDLFINSGNAFYKKENDTVVFSRNPKIEKGGDIYSAEEIIYHTNKKLLILDRNASVLAYSEEKDRETKKLKKERIIARGDRIENYDSGEKITYVKGNAEFEREDVFSTGDIFEIKGEGDNQEVKGNNVHINYKSENTEADGKYFKWYKKDGYSALWGGSSMTFRDKSSGEETSKVFGDYMEYYKDTDELYVSGKVRVVRDDGIIAGDMAKYRRPENTIRVFGNARIEKDNSVVLSQEILINTKNNETRLCGDIRGSGTR